MSEALATLHQDLQDLIGQTIADRYRVDELVGVGGMGAVFAGHHIGLKRDVAIKVLHPELTRHPEISARFDREAHSASRLDHTNCLQVTDYGSTENGMKFMVMQLLTGQELSSILGEPLPPARALPLAMQILRGLEHAHRHGVVHRDIKPENIFVVRDHEGRETLKLVDFGIAKVVDGTPELVEKHKTQAGLVFGTPAYMSPEQASGIDADERADLYSVGIILYEMLAGRPPFDHEDPVTLVRMQVGADPPPLPTAVPPVLAAVVEKLLAKDRDQRFQTATEALETFESLRALIDPDYISQINEISAQISGAINIGNSHKLTLPGYDRPRTSVLRDWRALTGFGAVLVFGLVWWLRPLPPQQDVARDASAQQVADTASEQTETVGVDAERLAELDRLIMADKLDEADTMLSLLRDEFPRDAQLLWRYGRLLAKRRNKDAQALGAYGGALDIEPSLLEDRDFYAELYELLRGRRVRDEALDLALHKMGGHGHKFLLELVNNEKRPLSYVDRRRALDELAKDPANLPLINQKLNQALDLTQANEALTPCLAFEQALELISTSGDGFYKPYVESAALPKVDPEKIKNGDDAARCEGAELRRQEVLAQLVELTEGSTGASDGSEAAPSDGPAGDKPAEPQKAAPKPTPAKSKSKPTPKTSTQKTSTQKSTSKSSRSRKKPRKRTNKCQKIGGIWDKDCWR